MAFAQAELFRGAWIDIVWPELATIIGLGATYLTVSLPQFLRSLNVG